MTGKSRQSKDLIRCACGHCDEWIPAVSYGRKVRFKHGHNGRLLTREKNSGWKGGFTINDQGYREIYMPDHRRARINGYVKEHILVYEEYHKCCLLSWAVIHHINEIRSDNRPENLMGLPSNRKHGQLHHPRTDMSDRKCIDCGATKSGKSKRRVGRNWTKAGENQWRCMTCYLKLYWENKRKGK